MPCIRAAMYWGLQLSRATSLSQYIEGPLQVQHQLDANLGERIHSGLVRRWKASERLPRPHERIDASCDQT